MILARGTRLALAGLGAVAVVPSFGSESYLASSPAPEIWHHEGLTLDAGAAAGWSARAASDLAFHATHVDHYLVNPLWRARGGPARWSASRAIRRDLATLHFDDLPTPALVARAWQRHLAGTVAALLWAAHGWEHDDHVDGDARRWIAAARQAVGLGLHAVQDFASHSTWINRPERRRATWREWLAVGGAVDDVVTGAVESDGGPRHGDLGLRRPGWHPVRVPLRWGIATPAWLTAHEGGINLDSRWQAPLGVAARGEALVGGLGGDEAFAAAMDLAGRSSREWLALLEDVMTDAGNADFWSAVTGAARSESAARSGGTRALAHTFEDPRQRAHVFLAAGARPLVEPDDDGWYLRTDATVTAASGHGRGSAVVRVLGPWPGVPAAIGAPAGGRIDAVTAFRRGSGVVEVRGYRVGGTAAGGAGPRRLALTETWRRQAALPALPPPVPGVEVNRP